MSATISNRTTLTSVHRHPPSLILASIVVPGLSNLKLLQTLQTSPSVHSLPVVLLSTQTSRSTGLRKLSTATSNCLIGPFLTGRLLTDVRTGLGLTAVHHRTALQRHRLHALTRRTRGKSRTISGQLIRVLRDVNSTFITVGAS